MELENYKINSQHDQENVFIVDRITISINKKER
jgi:hypothetical protein